eukprot:CAMPEP_0181138152 /NCGR_PEP_ID=MMETSP1071-20121207/34092_1 /TAXON_ID=35127 /ORGANISM="Thalassiosira sp., Strain NH16" /LENGTH=229 /DNA_ID=CAMNT_0023224965 /DNA_START=248 /DNA_END=938 /DNA_ORIENTATION=+
MKLWRATNYDTKNKISLSYTAKNFQCAMDSLVAIGKIAERENHHPDMHLTGYRNVEIVLFTHSLGGISANDIAMARMIDVEVDVEYSPKWLKSHPEEDKTLPVASATEGDSVGTTDLNVDSKKNHSLLPGAKRRPAPEHGGKGKRRKPAKERIVFTLEEKIQILNEIDRGAKLGAVADRHDTSRQGIRKWRNIWANIERQIEEECRGTKKRVANEKDGLKRIKTGIRRH